MTPAIAAKILEWIKSESDRRLFFQRMIDDALRQSAEHAVTESRDDVSPAAELAQLTTEITIGIKELSANGRPERLLRAMRRLVELFPELVPDSVRTPELDELLVEVQAFMRDFMDFLEVLPPEAYALIPDLLQIMLDVVGLIPVLGETADVISGVFSVIREEYWDVALAVISIIPIAGVIAGAGKILRRLTAILKTVRKLPKGVVREVLQALLKFCIDEVGKFKPTVEWFKKFLQRLREKLAKVVGKIKKPAPPDGKPPAPKDPKGAGAPRLFWTRVIDFEGKRVYQRSDRINPLLKDDQGRSSLQRMRRGLAPVGLDGNPMEIHHLLQTRTSPVAEMTRTFHQENSKLLHINPNSLPSGIDRKEFDAWRRRYWKNRAKDFLGASQ